MYKKSRIKIIILIMSVLLILFTSTLCIIYITTYREVATENRAMMELYATAYVENGSPTAEDSTIGTPAAVPDGDAPNGDVPDDIVPDGDAPDGIAPDAISAARGDRLQVSTFYSVAFSENTIDVTNDGPPIFTDEELVTLAEQIINKNKDFGMTDSIVYMVYALENGTLVVIMDNTLIGDTLNSLVHYMLLFGGIAVVILLVISYVFSGWIIRPLEENDKKQKQFVSDAGHELKTPISTINANAEILEREIGNSSWLSNIRYENDRMESIVKNLLDLARMQTVQTEMSEINLSRIFTAGVLPFEAQAYEKGVQLKYDVQENIDMKGNAYQIQMLTSILLDNALSHTAESGTICVGLKKMHNRIVLTVANQGKEIPLSDRERIFDRFYRADQAREGSSNHYGLGLAIAKNIVIIHKGKIYVKCENGWTSFCVEL